MLEQHKASKAYPRSHGATAAASDMKIRAMGLSPLARGNQGDAIRPERTIGPIPARTGQPSSAAPNLCAVGAYPRSHGATI